MYLKRFAISKGARHQLVAAEVRDLERRFKSDVKNVAVENGFYWGSDHNGVPHHEMEKYLGELEGVATPAFRRVLDRGSRPTDDALPPWPPSNETRRALSWWIAAQILRSFRQRARLNLRSDSTPDPPQAFQSANRHNAYIQELIEPLASIIFHRPWGVGFSDYCLLTGDVPVLVLNGQDHDEQLIAVEYWDIYLPLDPHRCLYLPGIPNRPTRAFDADHRLKLHPGHAIALNNAVADTAVKHIFFHPDHDPTPHLSPRQRQSLEVELSTDWIPRYLVRYEQLAHGCGVERKWLVAHPSPADPGSDHRADDAEVVDSARILSAHLDQSVAGFAEHESTRNSPSAHR